MTLNDLSTLPSRPLTKTEIACLDTDGWTAYAVKGLFPAITRFPVSTNDFVHWNAFGELVGCITPQSVDLERVQMFFFRDVNGARETVPVEVEPDKEELSAIAQHRRIRQEYLHSREMEQV